MIFLFLIGLAAQDSGKVAHKPLFRDAVYDGAADPVVIWNPKSKTLVDVLHEPPCKRA